MFAVERSQWHPVIASAALTAARAEAVTLLGEAVVLWRDQTGSPRAFTGSLPASRCAPLDGAHLACWGREPPRVPLPRLAV